jgi:hypothetical protein
VGQKADVGAVVSKSRIKNSGGPALGRLSMNR